MKFINRNILLIVLVTLTIINLYQCGNYYSWRTTPKKNWKNGDIFALTSHYLQCPRTGAMTTFQAQKSGNNMWFKFKCYKGCKGLKTYDKVKPMKQTTGWNATEGNKKKSLHFLDRHNVACKQGYSLQGFGLKRSGNRIRYEYSCRKTQCKKIKNKKSKTANMGANETKYFPRVNVNGFKSHHVLTGFKWQRTRGNDFHMLVHYCELIHNFKVPKKSKKKPASKPKPKPKPKKMAAPKPVKPIGRGTGRPLPPPIVKPIMRPAPRPIGVPAPPMPRPTITRLPARRPIGPSTIVGSMAYKDDIPTVAALTPAANFAMAKGSTFCAKHCVVNYARRTRQCILSNKYYDCKRCVMNPKMKFDNFANNICETICDSVSMTKPCDFFGYYNGNKKNISGMALRKFGLALIRRR